MSLLDIEQLSQRSRPHRFTLEEYHRMSEMNFFGERRVEFIDGEIIDVPPQFNPHTYVITKLSRLLLRVFPESEWWVRIQATLEVGESAPDPDFAVMGGAPDLARSYPQSENAVLVIEVSDSTLIYDTTVKSSLYAAGGVPEYWVVNIPDREIIVHRDPVEASTARFGWKYASVSAIKPGAVVSLRWLPELTIDPSDVLPPV